MATPTPRKPATPGNSARTPGAINSNTNPSITPSRSPTRMNASATGTAMNGVSRTRSVRGAAPPSARAAAAGRKTATPDSAAEQDAKAEAQAKMEELQERLQTTEAAYEEAQKLALQLKGQLDEAFREQALMDERVHEHVERIGELEGKQKEGVRARREMELVVEGEKAALGREREEWAVEREGLQSSLQRVKETLASRELRAGLDDERRPALSRQSSIGRTSPHQGEERSFAPSSLQRSDSTDSRHNSKLLIQKDKIIENLRLELAEAQIKLVEMENLGGGQLQALQKQMYETKMTNARLMEDNESFQLLLQEKALNGEFLQPPTSTTTTSRPPSRSPTSMQPGASLADELDSQADSEAGSSSEESRRLHVEVTSLKDQNKALTLYINNIISRLLQSDQFEQILDKTPDLMAGPNAAAASAAVASGVRKVSPEERLPGDTDKELPPPPPEKDEPPAGFLQRARSVMGGRPKRPESQIPQPSQENVPQHDLTDPNSAPSLPLTRTRSTQQRTTSGGHRRANSEWPAASVVGNMLSRGGASPAVSPLSPGLGGPRNGGNGFFGAMGTRQVSGSSSLAGPSVEGGKEKENAVPSAAGPQQRDSKFSSASVEAGGAGQRNSTFSSLSSSNSDGAPPNPPSPPRRTSTNLSRDESRDSAASRDSSSTATKDGSKPAPAVMMGSRMRPLRLVQEAAEMDEASGKKGGGAGAAGNRASWFGWMNKGAPPAGSGG